MHNYVPGTGTLSKGILSSQANSAAVSGMHAAVDSLSVCPKSSTHRLEKKFVMEYFGTRYT